ncbi:pro-opiomelanocortin-like [Anoplopoma fimbria]|uniref:pro-opiomelanocortin-like n=1 Tax=Anoplopoma fimbria TaxID=229290 RepID=UPI0023EAC7F4|nr:pro-opiomelanocortin-like [Anoplopoma fimbria]
MCPSWLLVALVVVGVATGAVGQCWEHPSCQELNSEGSMMECIQLCHADLTAETPLIPGTSHLQHPALSDPSASFLLPSSSSSSSSPQAKRSYSMEHFRWGKPVGRKRRPVQVYSSNGVEEESTEVFPEEMRRRELATVQEVMEEEQLLGGVQEKKDGPYKMKHFRWSSPSASKRYGFMKSKRPQKNNVNKE